MFDASDAPRRRTSLMTSAHSSLETHSNTLAAIICDAHNAIKESTITVSSGIRT